MTVAFVTAELRLHARNLSTRARRAVNRNLFHTYSPFRSWSKQAITTLAALMPLVDEFHTDSACSAPGVLFYFPPRAGNSAVPNERQVVVILSRTMVRGDGKPAVSTGDWHLGPCTIGQRAGNLLLLVKFGTNGEMVSWELQKLVSTDTPQMAGSSLASGTEGSVVL